MEWYLDLRVIPLTEGSVRAELEEDYAVLGTVKDMGVNLVTLPLPTLHALHQGVLDELRIKE